jgi:hypothetical protein
MSGINLLVESSEKNSSTVTRLDGMVLKVETLLSMVNRDLEMKSFTAHVSTMPSEIVSTLSLTVTHD